MKRGLIIILVVVIVIVLIVAGIFLFLAIKKEKIAGENCTVISENPGKNKIDIVFLTDNVPESKAKEYSEFLLNAEPFNESKEKFNFYYAGNIKCGGVYRDILFCYSSDAIKKSSVCPDDYIVVLTEQPLTIRSSAYINVLSINTNHPKSVFIHEFGHAFANLADEYVPSEMPSGAKNCVSSCEKLEDKEECFQGCSSAAYYRSSENSVMRTLSTEDYKKLNTQIIRTKLERYE